MTSAVSITSKQTLLDSMVFAVQKVRERLLRPTGALNAAHVSYAVAGGNAIAAWVAKADPAAVRNTQDVDILLRRSDLQTASQALSTAGFVYRHAGGVDMFLDGPNASVRDAIHVVPAGERIRPEYLLPSPDVTESQAEDQFQLIDLDALVWMKLTPYCRKDQVHLLDLLGVGLIDESWIGRLSPEPSARLRELIDTRDQ